MQLTIHADPIALGQAAGTQAGERLRAVLATQDTARLVIATGASQFATLATLVAHHGIDWRRVEVFHLDEYIGLPVIHPASFRRYLQERFVARVPALAAFHGVQGDAADAQAECARLGTLISRAPIDLLLLGIGENGHLAFNDPPADVTTRVPYLVVELDAACRQQQFGEGWFPTLDAVPRQAISMSIQQILSARELICSVPDARKARAVQSSLEGPVSAQMPGSYLRNHARCSLHLDRAAAGLLATPAQAAGR